MKGFVHDILEFYPYLTLTIVLIALATFIVFLAVALSTKSLFAKGGTSISMAGGGTPQNSWRKKTSLYVFRHESIARFFSWFGIFPRDDMSNAFRMAMAFLRKKMDGPKYRYQLPWFAFVGAAGSGKSTLLENSTLRQPFQRPNFYPEGVKPGCDWWFFDQAIVMDVRGSFLLNANTPTSDHLGWLQWIELLKRVRVRRPLDGIILAIPATELTGPDKLDLDSILLRADEICGQFVAMQRHMGLKLPVYVLITKGDEIPGFQNFCAALPEALSGNVCGWSSPFQVDELFSPTWVETAFSSMQEDLTRVSIDLFTAQHMRSQDRDGVLLFPTELAKLVEPLKTYLSHIFRQKDYKDPFVLRGIYVTGNSLVNPLTQVPVSGIAPPYQNTPATTLTPAQPKPQFHFPFVQALFTQKIFKEKGLAIPDGRWLISSNRKINTLRGLSALIVLVCGVGLYRDGTRLGRISKEYIHIFDQIQGDLVRLSGSATQGQDNYALYNQESNSTFHLLLNVEVEDLKYIFMPWVHLSDISKDVRAAMSVAYNEIIIHSMYLELGRKTQIIINDTLPAILFTSATPPADDPLQIPEFLVLKSYVDVVQELEEVVEDYNNLTKTHSIESLARITKFLFNYTLPKAFFDHPEFHERALSHLRLQPFDLEAYQWAAQTKLRQLFMAFLEAILGENRNYVTLNQLVDKIKALTNRRDGTTPTLAQMQALAMEVDQAMRFIEQPNLVWMNRIAFDPGAAYSEMMVTIQSSPLFGMDVATNMQMTAYQMFESLKKRLAQFKTPLTGTVLSLDDKVAQVTPSAGLISLQQNLMNYINQPYMAPSDGQKYVAVKPIGKVVFWDAAVLQDAVKLVEAYNTFIATRLSLYPAQLQESLKLLAQKQLGNHVDSLLAKAQSFVAQPDPLSEYYYEETVQSTISNVQTIGPIFLQLLAGLNTAGLGTTHIQIRDMVVAEMSASLKYVDEMMKKERLYDPTSNNFSWWQGAPGAAFEAYGVQDKTGMTMYLSAQRERVAFIAKQYAEPLLYFLNSPMFKLLNLERPLLDRWTRIVDQINIYERHQPGSIQTLQDYLLGPANTITIDNCERAVTVQEAEATSGDYFIAHLNQFKKSIYNQCQLLNFGHLTQQYESLQQFFYDNLSGRFPFIVPEELGRQTPDAPLEKIVDFFTFYGDFLEPGALAIQKKKLGASGGAAVRFLDQMGRVADFISAYGVPTAQGKLTPVEFDIEFRIATPEEIGAENVVYWEMTIGNQKSTLHRPAKLRWTFGEPIVVAFKWAATGPERPLPDAEQANLRVEGDAAYFVFEGAYAFLRMMMDHNAAPEAFMGLYLPDVLVFEIPVMRLGGDTVEVYRWARLFIRIIPRSQEQNKPFQVPIFPPLAPNLEGR